MTRVTVLLIGLLLWCPPAGSQQGGWDGHVAAGAAALDKGKFGAAREAFAAALKATARLAPHDRHRRIALTQLAAAEVGLGSQERAQRLLEQALDSWLASEQPSDLELAATLHGLARIYRASGQPAKARQRLSWALAIEEKLLPADDPAIARTREMLEGLIDDVAAPPAPRAEAPEPAEPARTIEASAGGYAVQLASYRSEQGAQAAGSALKQTLPDLLGTRELAVRRVELDGRGTFYRLLAGGFAERAAARGFCADLKARSRDCLVVRDGARR